MWYGSKLFINGRSDDIIALGVSGSNARLSALNLGMEIFRTNDYSSSISFKFSSPHEKVRDRVGYGSSTKWVYPIEFRTSATSVATRTVKKTDVVGDCVFELIGTNLVRYPIVNTDTNRNVADRVGAETIYTNILDFAADGETVYALKTDYKTILRF